MGRVFREEGSVVINVTRLQPNVKQIITTPENCWAYGYDNSRLHQLPQAVVFPTRHEQVVAAVKACMKSMGNAKA